MGKNKTVIKFKYGKTLEISNKILKQIEVGSLKVRDDYFRLKLDLENLKKEEKRVINKFLK